MAKPYYKVATLEPSNSVGYLVKSCGVLLTQIAERRFEALSANFTHWVTLMGLSRQQSPVSATQLSKELCHDMGAITRVVDAAPFAAPEAALLQGDGSVSFLETFLFRDDDSFQLRSLVPAQ